LCRFYPAIPPGPAESDDFPRAITGIVLAYAKVVANPTRPLSHPPLTPLMAELAIRAIGVALIAPALLLVLVLLVR
jgi:hypothetical protein